MRRTVPDRSTFAARLLRFLMREDAEDQRTHDELRALPVEARVLEGECIEGAILTRFDADRHVFRLGENLSKFRSGDAVAIGDGLDFDNAYPLVYGKFDAARSELVVERDRYVRRPPPMFEVGQSYVIDRRPLGIRGQMQDVVRAGFDDPDLAAVLAGEHAPTQDDDRRRRALGALATVGLNEAQIEAGAAAIGTESLALVQGPPGTGKTRLLVEVMAALASRRCRIALTAFTHRALDHALLSLRRRDPSIPVVKIGNPGRGATELRRAGVTLDSNRSSALPATGVIAGTPFALARLPAGERFHYAVFDEAGQMPIPHAIAGMLLARRWLFFGDHDQLPPVITASHADREVQESVFARLHRLYGSHLLDVSYRLNTGVCAVVGETFYGGRLRSSPEAADRRLPFRAGGTLDAVLDPDRAVVLARVDHLQPGQRSNEEAELCADLTLELRRRHGLPAEQIAIVAPFRAQVRAIRSALQERGLDDERLVVDTVERMQGQEREAVIVSLAVGDPATLDSRSNFFFSTNRLNVALSRARTKAILVASASAFLALPGDPEALRAVSTFKRLYARLPQVDLTGRYGAAR